MKTIILILAVLATPLTAQDKQPQKTEPTEIQKTRTDVKKNEEPKQKPTQQQNITFTLEQLDDYENKILDRSETFYSNRMTDLLWTMGILMGIGAIIIPLVISGLIQYQRKISFTKDLEQADAKLEKSTTEQIQKLRTELVIQIDDSETELEKAISTPLSMAFSGLGAVLSKIPSPEAVSAMLQSFILAKKYSIIGQRPNSSFTASEIVKLFKYQDRGTQIKLDTLVSIDEVIEGMKGDLDKIIDDKEKEEMKSQVKELQIFVHGLIDKKRQAGDIGPSQTG